MKFRIDAATFGSALGKCALLMPKRALHADWTMVRLDMSERSELRLTARGNEGQVVLRVPLGADAEQVLEGPLYFPIDRLLTAVKLMKRDDLTVSLNDNGSQVRFANGATTLNIPCMTMGFDLWSAETSPCFTMDKGDLTAALNRVVFAAATDEFRPAMTGVFVKGLGSACDVVATDGFRLARITLPIAFGELGEILMPSHVPSLLEKILTNGDVEVSTDDRVVRFATETEVLTHTMLSEKYVRYAAVIPTNNEAKCVVNRTELINAIALVKLFAPSDEKYPAVAVHLDGEAMQLTLVDAPEGGSGASTIPCQWGVFGNPAFDVGLNANYFSSILTRCVGEEVTLHFNKESGNVRPILITDDASTNVTSLLMPTKKK